MCVTYIACVMVWFVCGVWGVVVYVCVCVCLLLVSCRLVVRCACALSLLSCECFVCMCVCCVLCCCVVVGVVCVCVCVVFRGCVVFRETPSSIWTSRDAGMDVRRTLRILAAFERIGMSAPPGHVIRVYSNIVVNMNNNIIVLKHVYCGV